MEIIDIKVLRGPNYCSNYRKNLIAIKLDLKEYEYLPTNLIPGFTENLVNLLPTLCGHFCSRKHEGGFIERLKEGTWLGHVIEHVALELQSLSGMKCGFGRTRSANKEGVYHLYFEYEVESAGLYAGKAAIELVRSIAVNKKFDGLKNIIQKLKKINYREGLGISTKAIINEAKKRDIPYTRLDKDSLIVFGFGSNQKNIMSTITSNTSGIGIDIATNKHLTKKMLNAAFIPVPKGRVIKSLLQLDGAIEDLHFPLVIKPVDSNHGRGITTNILTKEKAVFAYEIAKEISSQVVVEHFIVGEDYRFLVINYKLAAVAKRIPASVKGDGVSTIGKLIKKINKDPKRGRAHDNVLTRIKINDATLLMLQENGMTLDTVLAKGHIIYLKQTANLSAGGTAVDVTDLVHPKNKYLAERIARLMKLDICGIDIVAKSIEHPITHENGGVIEVNAGPGLRMHLSPSEGASRNVAKNIMDMLYPQGAVSRIPIVAITGTNGKTTTARLISHFAMQAGFSVGLTTTDGIYINNENIYKGDCSGPLSAKAVLQDSSVNFAVLECARGGILRSGLGFDKCDVSILTNISEDHLGIDDIDSLEQLTRVKKVVCLSTSDDGYAILNADDDLVYDVKEDLRCHIALFSLHADNPRIQEHIKAGGLAAYVDNGNIIISQNKKNISFAKVANIPLTYQDTLPCMTQNVLAALLAGVAFNFDKNKLLQCINHFLPSPENTPGRMNIFNFGDLQILLDYAHNPHALTELKKYIDNVKARWKIGIIAAPGDRRDEDIISIGNCAAKMFDEIIIRHDVDGRGRTNEELTMLLTKGIKQINENIKISIISDEQEALQHVIKYTNANTFVVILPENALTTINYLKALKKDRIIQKDLS